MLHDPTFSYSMRNDYILITLSTWLRYFERLLVRDSVDWYFNNGITYDGPYFASSRITWLDYLVFDMIESNCHFLEHTLPLSHEGITLDNETVLPDSCFRVLEKYPHLSVFYNNFRNRVNIAAYIGSDKRTSYNITKPL